MNIRKVAPKDWLAVHKLVMDCFPHEKYPMKDSFPLMFEEANTFSYVAEDKGQIVSFIGVVPLIFTIHQKKIYGVSIGAVCTCEKYRGRGIGGQVLDAVIAEQKASSAAFILISGQGKLYLSHGAELFGTFAYYQVKKADVKTDHHAFQCEIYNGSSRHVYDLCTSLNRGDIHFDYGVNEMQKLVHAHGLANVMNRTQEIYLIYQNEHIQSHLIINREQQHGRMISFGENEAGTLWGLNELLTSNRYEKIEIIVNQTTQNLGKQLETAFQKESTNAGSIIPLQSDFLQLYGNQFPHTYNLRYI